MSRPRILIINPNSNPAVTQGLEDALTGKNDGPETSKSQSKKSDMMRDEAIDLMDDEMPEKSKPKKGASQKADPRSSGTLTRFRYHVSC